MGSKQSGIELIQKGSGNRESFVGLVELISETTATTLKIKTLVAISSHTIVPNF